MTRDVIGYIRFIHGYLFLLILYAFGLYLAGNTWEIGDVYLSWMLEFSAAGSAAYLVLSVLIILLLVLRRIISGKGALVLPIIITVVCSAAVLAVYAASEGLILILG